MKKISIYLRALPLVALLAFFGCDRDKDVTPNTPACIPVKQTLQTEGGRSPELYVDIEYNAQEKPIRITSQAMGETGWYNLLEYDDKGHLTKTTYYVAGQVREYQVYEYNQAARLVKATYHDAGGSISATFSHEYDSKGNRIKTMYESKQWGGSPTSTTTTYEYAGGNLVRSIATGDGWSGSTTEYEYYLDREHKLGTYEATVYGTVPNRNMLKKITQTYPNSGGSSTYTYDYTYEYNDKGFPTKMIWVSKGSQTPDVYTHTTSYEYQCR